MEIIKQHATSLRLSFVMSSHTVKDDDVTGTIVEMEFLSHGRRCDVGVYEEKNRWFVSIEDESKPHRPDFLYTTEGEDVKGILEIISDLAVGKRPDDAYNHLKH